MLGSVSGVGIGALVVMPSLSLPAPSSSFSPPSSGSADHDQMSCCLVSIVNRRQELHSKNPSWILGTLYPLS
jgi:hypothetical protein